MSPTQIYIWRDVRACRNQRTRITMLCDAFEPVHDLFNWHRRQSVHMCMYTDIIVYASECECACAYVFLSSTSSSSSPLLRFLVSLLSSFAHCVDWMIGRKRSRFVEHRTIYSSTLGFGKKSCINVTVNHMWIWVQYTVKKDGKVSCTCTYKWMHETFFCGCMFSAPKKLTESAIKNRHIENFNYEKTLKLERNVIFIKVNLKHTHAYSEIEREGVKNGIKMILKWQMRVYFCRFWNARARKKIDKRNNALCARDSSIRLFA